MRKGIARATPVALLGGTVALVVLGILVANGMTDGFDVAVLRAIRAPELMGLLGWLRPVTELGSTVAVSVVAVAALLGGIALGRPRLGVAGALTIGLAALANALVKLAIARERPAVLEALVAERGFSFPSGHAALSAVAYGVAAVLIARSRFPRGVRIGLAALCGLVIAAVGVSRVWIGVHYPTDVMAGWLAGLVVALAYAAVTRRATARDVGAAVEDRALPRSDPTG